MTLTPESAAAALDAGLLRLQLFAEARMREWCTIERVTDVFVDDEGREQVTKALVYEGPVRIRSFRPYPQERDVAEATSTAQMYDLHIPAPTRMAALLGSGAVATWDGPVRNGDVMTRTTLGRASEVYRIETEHDVTDQTAQRMVGMLGTGGVWA